MGLPEDFLGLVLGLCAKPNTHHLGRLAVAKVHLSWLVDCLHPLVKAWEQGMRSSPAYAAAPTYATLLQLLVTWESTQAREVWGRLHYGATGSPSSLLGAGFSGTAF